LLGLAFAGSDPAVRFRLGVWSASVRTAADSLVSGWGLGAFADALPLHKTAFGELRVEHAEDEYLEVLVETGLVGLALIVLAVAFWLRGVQRALAQEERRRVARAIAVGAAAGVIALCAHGLVDFNTRVPSNALLVGLLATLAVSSGIRAPSGARSVSGAALALLSSALLVIGRPLAPPIVRPDPGSLRDRRGQSLRGDLVELAFRDYVRQKPTDAEAWALLGWLKAARGDSTGGQALIRHAARLDPQRSELFENAARRARPALMP
jgi:membrane protein implicated in regulation of membrane protease activity